MSIENKNTDDIKEIIELVYISAFLKNEKPLSLLLLAPPENSKTSLILEKTTKFCHYSTDLSFQGVIKMLQEKNKILHIVIPDFLKITSKKTSTKNNLVSLLNAFLDEGIFQINLGNKETIDLKGRAGGVVTATTDYSFYQNRRNWKGLGFLSRFIVVSWRYKPETIQEIFNTINLEKNTARKKSILINYKKTEVKSKPEINAKLNEISDNSLRKLKNLQVLLKCLALKNGRNYTTDADIKRLKELNQFMNTDFKEI